MLPMKSFQVSFTLLLSLTTNFATAQQSSAAQQQPLDVGKVFNNALSGLNLTVLSSFSSSFSNQTLQEIEKGGNITFLAPADSAFKNPMSLGLKEISSFLAYHLVNESLSYEELRAAPGNRIVAPTRYGPPLFNSSYVNLLGQPQMVVVQASDKAGEKAIIQSSSSSKNEVKFVNATDGPRLSNLLIQPIDHVLSLPGNFSSELQKQSNLSAVHEVLAKNSSVVDTISSTPAITFFAPSNDAIATATASLAKSSSEDVSTIFANHVLNGTLAYSTWIQTNRTKWDQISATGQALKFRYDGNTTYISSGDTEARIIKADILTSNGVIHIIDRVLVNTKSDQAAAAAAVESARKNAATSTNGQNGQGRQQNASLTMVQISPTAIVLGALSVIVLLLAL